MRTPEATKIIYPELSYKLNGIFFEVHNKLGRFCSEKQYNDAIEVLLNQKKFNYEREKDLTIFLKDKLVGGNRVDFCIDNKILIDGKAKRYITREDYRQMKRYLEATGLKLGIIVNFRETSIRPRRVINSKAKETS